MDSQRFDDLTRALVRPLGRRGLFKTIAGAGFGVAASARVAGDADAACPEGQFAGTGNRCLCKTSGRPPGPDGCSCSAGLTSCTGVCTGLSSDPGNCGACGIVCSADQTCLSGSCIPWHIEFGGPGHTTFFIDDVLDIYLNDVRIYQFRYGRYDPVSFVAMPGDQLRIVGTNTHAGSPGILTAIELMRLPDGAVQILEPDTVRVSNIPIQVFYDKTFIITF